MNRPILLVSTLAALAATAALAQSPAPAPSEGTQVSSSGASDRTKMICHRESDSGSRLSTHRRCATQAEWDEQRRLGRMDVEKAQTNRSWCKNGPC